LDLGFKVIDKQIPICRDSNTIKSESVRKSLRIYFNIFVIALHYKQTQYVGVTMRLTDSL